MAIIIDEITKDVILNSFSKARKIDDDLVYRPQQNMEIKPLSNAIVYKMPEE